VQITGADLVVRSLIELRSRYIFNVPGFGIQPLVEAIDKRRGDIGYVTSVNETNISLIAQGYARSSGEPAFLNVYHSSGTALAMMAMTTSWADRVPLVLTSTTAARDVSSRDSYAAVPRAITEMSDQYSKWSFEVPSADRIPEALARAFHVARSAPAGPVHLAFPSDIYTQTVEDPGPAVLPESAARSVADQDGVVRASALLGGAQDPVLVLGAEVAQYGAIDEAVALAERVDATVLVEPYLSRLPFPTTNPRFAGSINDNAEAVREADVVLFAGCEMTERFVRSNPLGNSKAARIALTTDPVNLVKQSLAPSVELLGDPVLTLRAVLEHLGPAVRRSAGVSDVVRLRRDAAVEQREAIRKRSSGDSPLRAGDLVAELKAATEGSIMVNQAGGGAVYVDMLYDFEDPSLYYGLSAKASAQGWAVPASIGIHLANPGRRVVVFVGDGGFMFSSTAIHTAARLGAKILYVVLNNGGWIDIGESSRKLGGTSHEHEDELGWTFKDAPIDFVAFARSLGLAAGRCSTKSELGSELSRLLSVNGPALLEVISDPEDVKLHFERIG